MFRQCFLRPSAEHDMADAGDLPKEGCVISVQRSRQCPAFSLVSSARWCPALSLLLLMQCPRQHPLFRATQDCRNLLPYPGERTKMCLPAVCDSLPKSATHPAHPFGPANSLSILFRSKTRSSLKSLYRTKITSWLRYSLPLDHVLFFLADDLLK